MAQQISCIITVKCVSKFCGKKREIIWNPGDPPVEQPFCECGNVMVATKAKTSRRREVN